MTTQAEKILSPVSMFLRKILDNEPAITLAKPAAITVGDLDAMPKKTQLLVAHFLERDNNDLTLLDGDKDLPGLLLTGWLSPVPLSTSGVSRFKFKPHVWHQLRSLQHKFLTEELLYDLKFYRRGKTAAYPWVW